MHEWVTPVTLISDLEGESEQIRAKRETRSGGFAGDGSRRQQLGHQQNSVNFWPESQADLYGKYANDCLERHSRDSGLALQDIVNENCLTAGIKVDSGRYRGTKS